MHAKSSKSTGPIQSDSKIFSKSESTTSSQLTLFAADSHVSHTHSPASARRAKTKGICGENLPVSFASLNPDGSWQKMFQGSSQVNLDGSSDAFCGTWPRSGMMQNGIVSRLPPLVPLTCVTEFLSLPTPTAQEGGFNKSPGKNSKIRPTLTTMARKNLWPTPRSRDYFPPDWTREKRGAHAGDDLVTAVYKQEGLKSGGSLNPTWVEWLQGFPLGWTDCDVSETP